MKLYFHLSGFVTRKTQSGSNKLRRFVLVSFFALCFVLFVVFSPFLAFIVRETNDAHLRVKYCFVCSTFLMCCNV